MPIEKTIKDYVFKTHGTLVSLDCSMFNEMLNRLQEFVGQAYGEFASQFICEEWLERFNKSSNGEKEWMLMEYACAEQKSLLAGRGAS